MAFYVKMAKMEEDTATAKYRFSSDGVNIGYLAVHKKSGEIELLEAIPGDDSGNLFERAFAKLRIQWTAGALPSVSEWAS